MNEAHLPPEEKAFLRLVEQFPTRPLPIVKAAIGFAVYTATIGLLCLGLLIVF